MIQAAQQAITNHPPLRNAIDTTAYGSVVLTWMGVLEPVAAFIVSLLSGLWFALQIYTWVVNKRWRKKDEK